MAVDWIRIRNDYINGGGSYRKLAEKHGVSFGALRAKAKAECWVEKREQQLHKIATKTAQKTAERISDREAGRMARLLSMADRISDQLDQAIEELDRQIVKKKQKLRELEYKDRSAQGKPTKETITETEELEIVEGPIDRLGLQQLTTALKNLKEVISDAESAEPPEDGEDDPLTAALKEEFL